MSRSYKRKNDDPNLSKNHGQKKRFRLRHMEEKEQTKELKEFFKTNATKPIQK